MKLFDFQTALGSSIRLGAIFLLSLSLSSFGQNASPNLHWDSTAKETIVTAGETAAEFVFSVTNVSDNKLAIEKVQPSCGCTVAKLPPLPWVISPGKEGQIQFSTDVRGKQGSFIKTATVKTSMGVQVLTMRVTMPSQPSRIAANAAAPILSSTRAKNQEIARLDHQAVFKGDCVSCHAEPAKGKVGKELYAAVCGICHDGQHRAEAVPVLGKSPLNSNPAYWRTWITFGKPGSMMPGFSKSLGGPLEPTQIESLAAFLADKHGSNAVPTSVKIP